MIVRIPRTVSFLRKALAVFYCAFVTISIRYAIMASTEVFNGRKDGVHLVTNARTMAGFASELTTYSDVPSILWPLLGQKKKVLVEISTAENYKANDFNFYGRFAAERKNMDYTYHVNYIKSRQIKQDEIIESYLKNAYITDRNGDICLQSTQPWIVFTAGAMGSGKSHTLRYLSQQNLFPLKSFVWVDPDDIRHKFPEFNSYVETHPEMAGELTRSEAGYLSELLTTAALKQGRNVLVDGSLRDSDWYKLYFEELRELYPNLRIGILYVTAPRAEVFKRAETRSKITGRVVPKETIELALRQVPTSVRVLQPLSDFFCELHNPPSSSAHGIQLHTEDLTWESFKDTWIQNCANKNILQDL
jgi:hypothetical protein